MTFGFPVPVLLQVRSALSGLEELDLSDLRYLSDLTFTRLTGCTPCLRRLALAGCHIAFEFDPYGGRPTGAGEDSSALLSLRNLRCLLAQQRATLRELDLSRTAVTPESLRIIAQVSRGSGCRSEVSSEEAQFFRPVTYEGSGPETKLILLN